MSGPGGTVVSTTELEAELLGSLGLGADATPERIASTHDAVVGYLAEAPRALRGWARAQAAAADEAYALLSDPAALAASAALAGQAGGSARAADGTAETPARRAATRPPKAARRVEPEVTADDDLTDEDELDELIAAVTPSAHRDEVQRPRSRPSARDAAVSGKGRLLSVRLLAVAAALVALPVVAVVGYNLGGSGAAPVTAANSSPTALPSPTLDASLVATLMRKIQADPNDKQSLMSLGDAFFQAGQYQTAADWLNKLVKIDPKNSQALLALGAADYNAGDAKNAETAWKQVLTLDPKSVEAHYDLGFLYLQQQPPDMAGVQREWQQVVVLAPGTQIAQNVQAHLAALASTAPGASVSPAAVSPAASAAASTAPAASAAPSTAP